jgi:polyhydroxyalkanoate synthesis regulator phasin
MSMRMQADIESLKRQVEELRRQIEELRAEKRGPGRPKKEAA